MKTQFKRFSKSTISVLLAVCLLFSCMTVGIIATDAANDNSEALGLNVQGYIYFIKPSDWTYASLMVGKSDYSQGFNMSNISGTDLYYINQGSWNGATEFAFFDVNNWGGEGNSISSRANWAAHSSTVNSSYGMNSGSTYLIATTANSPTYYSAGYSAMNADLTVKTMLKSGSSYAETSTKCGTFSATNAKKLSGNGASAASSISQTNGTATLTTARTNTATISQSAVSGYTFKGWKTSKDTTGSGLSSGDYSFTNSGSAATVYAYYEPAASNYTVTYGTVTGYANGTATATVTSGSQVTSGTSVTFTATPTNSNYQFVGWYGNTSGTGSVVSSNASYTTTINSATSLYAKFVPVVQITAGSVSNGSLSIAYTKPNGTSGTLTTGSAYILSGSNVTVTATASSGYYVTKIGTDTVSGTYPSTGSKTYSSVTSAATYTATFASTPDITFYVCNDASWSQINYYIYTGNGGDAVGTAWPGAKISSTAIGTIDDKNVYQVTLPKATYPRSDAKCIILSNNGSNQYNGDGAVTLTDGYIYYTNDNDASEATTYSASMLDAPSHNITFTPSPTGGTVTVGGSSTSPTTAREGNTYEIKATPSSGYYVSTIKVGNTSVYTGSMSSTGAKTANGTMGTADQTVTVTFAKINYTLTKNSTSNGSFKLTNASGTEISTAQVGDTVKVVPTPETGYQTGTVARGTSASLGTTVSGNQFTMPANNQYVGVTFTEVTGTVKGAAYTGTTASTTGGTVNNTSITVGISTNKSIKATKKSYYDFNGWKFSGTKVGNLRYRFGTSGDWLTPAADTLYGTSSNTTIYIKTDGSSGITTSNAEVRAMFSATSYSYTTNAKYSTDGSSYNDTLSAGVTPASGNATNATGVNVTAPATVTVSNVKYNFVDFQATNGSVGTVSTSGSNKTTTFKPTAASAVCTARYKKVYTITSSVNSTNATGVGTVTTSVSEVAAGGSYTITATPGSHSDVESVTVNNTAKTATTSQEISGVTANQTVVVKFKSRVLLKGTMNSTAWAGEEMTSNSGGTSFTITKTLNASTTYQFRLYADDEWKANSVTTWTLNNIATHSTSGDNLTITPSVKANVTFVSDGTKFTSITAVPYDSTTYNVTLKKVAGSTITCTYMGTEYTTASADAVVPVYSGTEINFTVTPASDKYLSGLTSSAGTLSPAFAVATHSGGYTGKIASVAAASTITPTVANKLKVTCTTNKVAWGTVTADAEYAKPGDIITLTYTPSSGTLKTLTAYNTTASSTIKVWERDSNGDMKVKTTTSANQMTQVGITGLAGSIYSFLNKAGEALGASDASSALGADAPLTFTMPNGAVTVTATYEEYVGTSEYVYHGVDTSGNAVSGYEAEPMSEGSVGGQKYAYYNVTGREGVNYDQVFYISKDVAASGDRYVYFTNNYNWDNLRVYFYGGSLNWNWPGDTMSSYGDDGYGHTVYRYKIPSGATGVIFNNNTDQCKTSDIDLTSTNGAYYLNGSGSPYTPVQWDSNVPSDAGLGATVTNYKWGDASYSDHWFTGGFNNQNTTNSGNCAKPKDGNSKSFGECKDDYYIVVLYPSTEYTFNNNTETTGSTPTILWMKNLPGQEESTASYVKVYAKDGTIRRDGDDPERNNMTYSYFEQHANTFVYSDSGYAVHAGTRSSHDGQSSEGSSGYNGYTYDYIQKFEKGQTLYIKTNLDSTLTEHHYLVAYSINGKCYKLHTAAEGASVTEAFTVPEDWEDNYVEITPIYFPKDASNCITFYIEGYDETVMNAGWGNTPYVYPFYQDQNNNYVANINNAFGGYPGQPMVFYQGNYYTMLPKQYTTTPEGTTTQLTCTVKGVTLGNGYWDDIHILTGEVKSHFQTYDYDDLYKIYKEYIEGKGTGGADADRDIICSFKYRTKKNNDEPSGMNSTTAANYNSTNGNGWEVLTDYYGRPVDVFGTLLKDDALTLANSIIANNSLADSASVVHAISQDYKSNSAGDYGTEWAIYNTSGTKVVATSGGKTTIVPSALAISNTNDFANYDAATRSFQNIYNALKADQNVVGKPVVVTYEKSIYGGSDKADRCDARWAFSTAGESITATTRIEYTDDGKTWTTDTYNANTGTGSHTGTKAYFTGKAATAVDTPTDTSGVSGENTTSLSGTTGGGYYTFKAENAGQYEFVGWYLLRDNYQNISVRSSYASDATQFPSHAQQSKNGDVFVARFKKTATGTLDIYHEVHPQTTGYGNVYVQAVVKDSGGNTVATYGSITTNPTSTVKIPNTYIRSGEGYKVEATFKAVPYGTSTFENFYATVNDLLANYDGYGFISGTPTIDMNNMTATVTYDVDSMFSVASGSPVQTVTNVTHYSKFSLKDDLTYNLEYTFNTRYYGTKVYKYTNKAFTAEELRSYFRSQIEDPNDDTINIDEQFVQRKAPFESNYREDLTWDVNQVSIVNNVGKLTATQVPIQWANAMVYDFDDEGDMQTTQMTAPLEKLFDKTVHTKPANADQARQQWDTTCTDDKLYTALRTSYINGSGDTVPLYLHHWEAYQLDSFTYNTDSSGNPVMEEDGYNLSIDTGKSTLVCKSYSTKFNYIGYEDYAIVPVYTTDPMSTPERQAISDSRTDCSATLLTITRNHWNENASGNTDSSSYRDGADRLYVDMMLNYNYSKNGQNILLKTTGSNIKVGFILKSYTYTNTGTGTIKTYTGNSKVVVLTDAEKQQIDNKNRIEYCYGFKNSENNSQWGLNFEFTPFIVDTADQANSEGDSITIGNTPYKMLYSSENISVLDNVTFYRVGRYEPISWTPTQS